MAMVLAVMHYSSNRSGVWSSVSFWLAALGLAIGGVALAGAGLVQTYMERILSFGYLDTQAYLIPLYLFWLIGLLIVALELLIAHIKTKDPKTVWWATHADAAEYVRREARLVEPRPR